GIWIHVAAIAEVVKSADLPAGRHVEDQACHLQPGRINGDRGGAVEISVRSLDKRAIRLVAVRAVEGSEIGQRLRLGAHRQAARECGAYEGERKIEQRFFHRNVLFQKPASARQRKNWLKIGPETEGFVRARRDDYFVMGNCGLL